MFFILFIIYFLGILKNIYNKYFVVLLFNGYLNRLINYGLVNNLRELFEKIVL